MTTGKVPWIVIPWLLMVLAIAFFGLPPYNESHHDRIARDRAAECQALFPDAVLGEFKR